MELFTVKKIHLFRTKVLEIYGGKYEKTQKMADGYS